LCRSNIKGWEPFIGTQLPCFLPATFFLSICDRLFFSTFFHLRLSFCAHFISLSQIFSSAEHIFVAARTFLTSSLLFCLTFFDFGLKMQFIFALLAFFACLATSASAAPHGMQSAGFLMVRDGDQGITEKEHVDKKTSKNNAGTNATDTAAATDTATNATATAVTSSNSTADAAAAANNATSTVTVTVTASNCAATDATGVNATAATDANAAANATDVSAATNATDAAAADASATATEAAATSTTSTSSKKNDAGKKNKSDAKTVVTDLFGGLKKREYGRRGLVNRLILDGVLDL
ncbi:uncharacterized protein EV420DRAFT_484586, partial [Desarmillaria tabescens]